MSNLSHLTNAEVLRHLSGASLTELERELIGRLAGENVYLDDDGAAIAMELGSGNISEGIRIALAMASTMEHVWTTLQCWCAAWPMPFASQTLITR